MGRNTPSFTAIGFWNAAPRFGSGTSRANGVHGSSTPARSALVAVDCASAPQTAATLHSPRAIRAAAVRFRALERLDQQGEGFEARGNFFRAIDDFSDADNDGNAVFGKRGGWV